MPLSGPGGSKAPNPGRRAICQENDRLRRIDLGVTLVEILLALFLIALVLFPILRAFSQSYRLSTKAVEQELALKIAEAAVNKLMSVRFQDLSFGPPSLPIPFEVFTSQGAVNGNLVMAGSPPLGTGTLTIGKSTFRINSEVRRIFEGPPGNPKAMTLAFGLFLPPPPPGPPPPVGPPPPIVIPNLPPGPALGAVATYSCPNEFLHLIVQVSYGDPVQSVALSTFRADLNR